MSLSPLRSLLVLLLVCSCATVPPVRPLPSPVKYRSYFETFPTGVRLFVHEAPSAARVSMNVSYRVGSADEPEGKEGMAHLVEHLTFRARHGRAGAPTVWSRLLALGAAFNATTSADETDYFSDVPVAAFRQQVAVEASRMANPLAGLTPEEFAIEKEVVLAELRQRYETSSEGREYALVRSTVLAGHPYGHLTAGSEASLRSITLEDVQAFVRQHYTPAHAVVVVSGPVDLQTARVTFASEFATLATGRGGPKVAPVTHEVPPVPEADPARGVVVHRAPVPHPRLYMVLPLPGFQSGLTVRAEHAASLVGAAIGAAVWNDKRVHSYGTFVQVMDGVSLVISYADLHQEQDANGVAERLADKLYMLGDSQVVANGVYISSWARQLNDSFLEVESPSVTRAAQFIRAFNQPDYIGGWQKQVQEAFRPGPDLYAEKYLRRERAHFVLVAPSPDAGSAVLAPGGQPGAGGAEERDDVEAVHPSRLREVRRLMRAPGLDQAERFKVGHLEVVALPRKGVPAVDVRLVLRVEETGGEGWRAHVPTMATSMSWGLLDPEYGPRVGARSHQRIDRDVVVMGGTASSANLEHLLHEVGTWVSGWKVAVWSLDYLRDRLAMDVERSAGRPDMVAAWRLQQAIFPGHEEPSPVQPRRPAAPGAGASFPVAAMVCSSSVAAAAGGFPRNLRKASGRPRSTSARESTPGLRLGCTHVSHPRRLRVHRPCLADAPRLEVLPL